MALLKCWWCCVEQSALGVVVTPSCPISLLPILKQNTLGGGNGAVNITPGGGGRAAGFYPSTKALVDGNDGGFNNIPTVANTPLPGYMASNSTASHLEYSGETYNASMLLSTANAFVGSGGRGGAGLVAVSSGGPSNTGEQGGPGMVAIFVG